MPATELVAPMPPSAPADHLACSEKPSASWRQRGGLAACGAALGVRSLKLQGNTRARADRTTSFLLAPPSLWPGVSAGGWCVKVMKSTTKPDVTTVKFNDSTVTFSFAVVASWKPVS
ncbi:hypothetical protein EMIHUDRAFT_223478 [Emiliania huxleyi CCMP1516]|uniref:Uncharacterized protein n=2 Tax=Emiliania huxleyi TaxID=2903 RepID=A0A0D3KU84_EMIH1|nr:hypothetical protein EMIHUDRAFT_223478 [Emiliania huxleyi CCMP1516]EOD39319.1 hypothetical protein EMIHUDRAFT_223478 [Emiliania huxleyi CCMP1516]|eukprot:XP_005791748.1 hypothetical protein EMIHUDRAFT_223478 [Emiliania huxleyi CCMP1516]